jgi:CRP-like cAMP-binding protein/small-conductance mechanosensitive channel
MIDLVAGRWSVVVLLLAVVVIAFFVNRFAPAHRKRLRRVVILFMLAVAAEVLQWSLGGLGVPTGEKWAHFASMLLQAFTAINIGAILFFDLLLPAFSIGLPGLVTDLSVGAGYVVVTFGLLKSSNVELTGLLTTSAVVSAVLALSLQSTLGNVIGGVAMQLDGSIHAGDWIQLENGRQGLVKQIRWRHTVLETRDWGTLIVPNATLLSSQILVLGKREGQPLQHRFWVYFNVDFRYPPSQVCTVVTEALQASPIPNVADEPKPHCISMDFASPGRDSFAYYAVRYWLTDLAKDDLTNTKVRERLHAALRRADIPLARAVSTTFLAPGGAREEHAKRLRKDEKGRNALRTVELFKDLTAEERESLVDNLRMAPFVAGEIVTRKGAVAHWLYLLVSGTVEISIPAEEGRPRRVVARIEAPSYFGEMGMMTGEPRRADVHAVTDVECFRLDKVGFQQVVHERPSVANEMSQTLAKRRVQLTAAHEEEDEAARNAREKREAAAILEDIKKFFALS